MIKVGYIFMIAGAALVGLPFVFACLMLFGQMPPLQVFAHEPGLIDLSSLWNLTLNFVILSIMIKAGSTCLQYGAEATKVRA